MIRFYCFILLLCMGMLSWAQPTNGPAGLSLDEAVGLGIGNSLELRRNSMDLASASYSAERLWSELFPTISASAGISYSDTLFSEARPGAVNNNPSASASFGINLGLNAGIPFAMKNIVLGYQARLLSYEDARNQLELRITRGFYGLIADRDNLLVLTDILELAGLQYERDRVAFGNGRIGELTLMNSSLALENARFALSGARSAFDNRMGDFLVLIGLEGREAVPEGEISIVTVELDAERLIMEKLSGRPDIVARRREIERLENALKQNLASTRAPSVRLEAGWNSRSFEPFADSISGGATLSIPLDPWVPGTRSNQSSRNARTALEQARLDLQIAETAAAAQIRSLTTNLGNLWNNVEIARLGLGIAERSYELTDVGFRSGTVDSLRLADARNNLAAARQRLLQSELSYFLTILDISAALNIGWKELMQ